ncbi:MAG TPA: PQQ-dependent sugar dehydrogenase [Solirubrobacteraceae bacterium]|nr:PQQ-dependent sugar dehydrogenase [Solirubrobacteraceae bacterium]
MRLPVLLALLLAMLVAGCGDEGGASPPTEGSDQTATTGESPADEGRVRAQGGPEVSVIAEGMEIPWDVTFLPDGAALVTERPGRVRRIDAQGRLRDEPVARVEVSARGEGGLLGIDLDPRFEDGRRFAYLYATTAGGMEVQRWSVNDDGSSMTQDGVVLDGIAAGPIHDSGRLRFGPDGALYVLTGDAGRPELAQDPRSLNGKVLRLTAGQFRSSTTDPQIVSRGHRNPQGLDWQPGPGRLFATEHGPTCCDEVNLIGEGDNYGWPEVVGEDHGDFTAPVQLYQETIAPSGATFVSEEGSSWTGDFVLAALAGRELHRLELDGGEVVGDETLLEGEFGRLRGVVEAPDGSLWITTSNRDGRGDPAATDDRIIRLVPPAGDDGEDEE